MPTAEAEFTRAVFNAYEEARELGYNATYFVRLLYERGAVNTTKHLLATNHPQEGLTRLWAMGRLDLTVEAIVLRPEFEELFTDAERAEALRRLKELHYTPT